MNIEEIEIPIKGSKKDIEKTLLKNGFEIFYKVLTITSYYVLKNESIHNHKILKEKCKRLRYVEPLSKFENAWQNYKDWITKYDKRNCIKEENKLLSQGYVKIYTDEKTDFVYKKINEEKMYFQIQDIKDDCLIIAYDNEKYYNFTRDEQRKMLIADVKKYGIEIIDDNDVDRFKLIGKILSINEIIEKMNEALMNLGINKISIIFYNSSIYNFLRKFRK